VHTKKERVIIRNTKGVQYTKKKNLALIAGTVPPSPIFII